VSALVVRILIGSIEEDRPFDTEDAHERPRNTIEGIGRGHGYQESAATG
jgi:hypothetical protein